MRVLVVDDSRAMRAILGQIMRELGFEVQDAGNGLEALAKLREATLPDVMLLDWNMPEMNGYDVVVETRKNPSWAAIPIVMVTTETEMEHIAMALTAGANEYVMKPFTKEVLAEKLELLGLKAA